MARYRAADVFAFLRDNGCTFEGDATAYGLGFYGRDGIPFTFPNPVDDFFDADVVDRILSDRWIWTGPSRLTRYPD